MLTIKLSDWDCFLLQRAILLSVSYVSCHSHHSYLQALAEQQEKRTDQRIYQAIRNGQHQLRIELVPCRVLLKDVLDMRAYDYARDGNQDYYYEPNNYTALIKKLKANQ